MRNRPWELLIVDIVVFLAGVVIVGAVLLAVFSALCLGQSVSLEWDPNTEPDLAGYNIYRGEATGGPYIKQTQALIACGSGGAACTNYSDDQIEIGTRYYYVATAVDTEDPPLESGFSNEVNFGLCIGDVNLDGQRNVLDSLQIMNHAVGNIALSGNALAVADVNEDEAINVLDVLTLQNHIVGNIFLPPCP